MQQARQYQSIENNGSTSTEIVDKGKNKALEFSLENFPNLAPLPSRSSAKRGTASTSGQPTLPHDRGGGFKTQ